MRDRTLGQPGSVLVVTFVSGALLLGAQGCGREGESPTAPEITTQPNSP